MNVADSSAFMEYFTGDPLRALAGWVSEANKKPTSKSHDKYRFSSQGGVSCRFATHAQLITIGLGHSCIYFKIIIKK